MNKPPRQISLRRFAALREKYLGTVGIMFTDRCPVGCAHCSVDSVAGDSGPNEHMDRLIEQLHALCAIAATEVVVVTGGEPFVHLSELVQLVEAVTDSGKEVAVHTSGFWGTASGQRGELVQRVLQSVDAVVFGIDVFHRERLRDGQVIAALTKAHSCGAGIVAKVLHFPEDTNDSDNLSYARSLFTRAFGRNWERIVEVDLNKPIARGRASDLAPFRTTKPVGFCSAINGPVLRYHGTLLACCNESLLRLRGPSDLIGHVSDSISTTLDEMNSRPLVELMRGLPAQSVLELVARVTGGEEKEFATPCSACEACWRSSELLSNASLSEVQRVMVMARFRVMRYEAKGIGRG